MNTDTFYWDDDLLIFPTGAERIVDAYDRWQRSLSRYPRIPHTMNYVLMKQVLMENLFNTDTAVIERFLQDYRCYKLPFNGFSR